MADKGRTVEQQVLGLAEQLGRLIGTVEHKAEGWLDEDALRSRVQQIRDSASELLEQLGGAIETGRAKAKSAKAKAAKTKGGS
jgi:hypothetical protein